MKNIKYMMHTIHTWYTKYQNIQIISRILLRTLEFFGYTGKSGIISVGSK